MPLPNPFPQFSPHAQQGPHSFHPIDSHSSQDASSLELKRETREGRPRQSTSDVKTRSRSSSTSPDGRFGHDNSLQHRTGFSCVSANGSRTWAPDLTCGLIAENAEINVQFQGQDLIKGGGPPATQFVTKVDPRRQRNSVAHPPAPTSERMSVSSLVDSPVIPGAITNSAHVPNRLRKDSYQRPRILFYHKHEPHYGFTNFSDHPVLYQDRRYPTSEHLFQSFKVCRILRRIVALIIR